MSRVLALLGLMLLAGVAAAHALAPALLELRAEGASGEYLVHWRSSLLRAPGGGPRPVLPVACERVGEVAITDAASARSEHWRLRCPAPLAGEPVAIAGLAGSGINVIVRWTGIDGVSRQQLLDERRPAWTLPAPAGPAPVFASYLRLGVEHLLSGFDHGLFVLGLVLLVPGGRRLLWTVTAFTVGHSLTLSLAALELLRVPPGLTEFGIALSLLVLGVEVARPAGERAGLFARRPGLVAAGFGLLHGLGFAGVLAEIGLPAGEVVRALLAFNLGIELGQMLLVVALLALGRAGRRLALPWPSVRLAGAYVVGTLAAYWCLERVGGLFSA